MKIIKYLMIVLAVVAVLAAAGWLLRNSIIQRISNPILAQYDIELVDVSLDALATSDANIGYLKLLHDKGTTIVVEDLQLPISARADGVKAYSAQKVSIVTTTRDEEATFELALLIDQFLSLADNFAGNEIRIGQFDLAPYPSVRDLRWAISDSEQRLSGTVESIRMLATTRRIDPANYDITFSLLNQPDSLVAPETISGRLIQDTQGLSIAGESVLDLPRWQALTKLAGILPNEVELESGAGKLQFEAQIPLDVSNSPSASAILNPTSPWQVDYLNEAGETTEVLLSKGSPVDIDAKFPDVEWSMQQADAALLVTNGEWRDIPVAITGLKCQSGPTCSMGARISSLDMSTPLGRAAQVEFSSAVQVSFPVEGVRVDVQPDAHLRLLKFSSPDHDIARLEARLVSAAAMQYADNGWHLTADSIDSEVESLSLGDGFAITSPLFFEKIVASENELVVSASAGIFAPAFQTILNGRNFALPGIRGNFSLQDDTIEFDLATVDLFEDGTIRGQHDLSTGVGAVAINDTAITFNANSLAMRVAPWEFDFDISAGNLAVDLEAGWKAVKSATEFSAQSTIRVDSLAGYYTDTVFTGLSSVIELEYSDTGLAVAPTTISADLIDMGLTIENISADIALDADELAVDVDNLEMTAFNGMINAAPFSFHTGRNVNNITLTARELELTELLSIKEFAAISVTGTIGAVLPIAIERDGISISAGTLTGEPPGGIIRYRSGDDAGDAGASSIALVTSALSNFEYESLTSDVSYSKNGDLMLQMRLKGRNPDLDDSRPVVLNLGVENNVPQMLKSLQAARAVEEILENRLAE